MNLRDWLIIIGLTILIMICLDGYRRLRLARKHAKELNFGLEEIKSSLRQDDDYGSELPNGGARKKITPIYTTSSSNHESSPVMNETNPLHANFNPLNANEVSLQNQMDNQQNTVSELSQAKHQSYSTIHSNNQNIELSKQTAQNQEATIRNMHTAKVSDELKQNLKEENNITSISSLSINKQKAAMPTPESTAAHVKLNTKVESLLVLNVVAIDQYFQGEQLNKLLKQYHLYLGDKSIFHYYNQAYNNQQIWFSVANGIEPGYFTMTENAVLSDTPALTFFMLLPGPENTIQAFNTMLLTAKDFAHSLGGRLKDEKMNPISDQSIELYRQMIQDYERRQLLKHAAIS